MLHAVVNDDLAAVLDDATPDLPLAAGLAPTGSKLFHNVRLTDYVPGSSPDSTSTMKATLVPGSMGSNEVLIRATLIQPAPPGTLPCTRHCLPNTGAAPYLLQLAALGGLALIAGTALVSRGRRHRSG